MKSQLRSTMTGDAIYSGRSDAIRNIEAAFSRTLMNEGIKATISFTSAYVSVYVESEEVHDKVKSFLASINNMKYWDTDFYPADDEMPAEWYLRFQY